MSEENMARVVNAERYEKLRRFFCSRNHCTYLGGNKARVEIAQRHKSDEVQGVIW